MTLKVREKKLLDIAEGDERSHEVGAGRIES